MEVPVSLILAVFLSLHVSTALEGCSYATKWTNYGETTSPRCSGTLRTWWERDTRRHGRAADCELSQSEWEPVEDCADTLQCNRMINSSTTALEYCCTSGDNPALNLTLTEQRKCFSLSVCPLITSVAVPPKLFADSQASFYVTVATHSPSAFNHPCISHPCISHSASDTSPPSLLPPRIATHTGFLEVTVAYSITVPSVGSVTLNLDPLTAVHSTCGATVVTNLGYHSSYELDIVEGAASDQQPLCPTPTPSTTAATATVTVTELIHPSPSPSQASPTPPPPSTTPHSLSSSPSSSPPSATSSPKDATCSDPPKDRDVTVVYIILSMIVGGFAVAMVVAVVATIRFFPRLCRRISQVSSRKNSISITSSSDSPDSPTMDSSKLPVLSRNSFSPPLPPVPPLPSSPPSQPHHLIIASNHESSGEGGAIVTAPSPSSQQGIYSVPDLTPHSSHRHTSTTPSSSSSSPQHTVTDHTVTELPHSTTPSWQFHCLEPTTYAFLDGHLYRKEEDRVEYLDPALNIGPPATV